MLELSAQIVEREGVGIGVVDLSKDKKLAKKLQIFEIGAIWCFHRGHEIEFNGQRSADVLVEFLLDLDEYPVEDINNKKVSFWIYYSLDEILKGTRRFSPRRISKSCQLH